MYVIGLGITVSVADCVLTQCVYLDLNPKWTRPKTEKPFFFFFKRTLIIGFKKELFLNLAYTITVFVSPICGIF